MKRALPPGRTTHIPHDRIHNTHVLPSHPLTARGFVWAGPEMKVAMHCNEVKPLRQF